MIRLYDFECVECQSKFESIYRDNDTINCPTCNSENVDRLPPVFRINMGACGAYGYYDDNLEAYVGTNAQRKELMRQKGVTERGGTPKPTGDAWV